MWTSISPSLPVTSGHFRHSFFFTLIPPPIVPVGLMEVTGIGRSPPPEREEGPLSGLYIQVLCWTYILKAPWDRKNCITMIGHLAIPKPISSYTKMRSRSAIQYNFCEVQSLCCSPLSKRQFCPLHIQGASLQPGPSQTWKKKCIYINKVWAQTILPKKVWKLQRNLIRNKAV